MVKEYNYMGKQESIVSPLTGSSRMNYKDCRAWKRYCGFRPAKMIGVVAICTAFAACERKEQAEAPEKTSPESNVLVARLGEPATFDYTPPAETEIPNDSLGASIRRGKALLDRTTQLLPEYAPGNIQCSSCHIDAGRTRDAAPLIGVAARFPKYMDRTGAVISLQDRVNYCFTRSLAGKKLPVDSREMTDIMAWFTFISTGVPQGARVKGEGIPQMPKLTGDTARGAQLYKTICVACHGPDGQGTPPTFPALWGKGSYSIGASMAREERAAAFIRHFMPQNARGSLTDQQAYDLAAYINSRPRIDSPAKSADWPLGGAPADVPYNTVGHQAYRPPATLLPRADSASAVVPAPKPLARRPSP